MAFISTISLLEEYRGKGIGKKLLDIAFDESKQKGMKKMRLFCRKNNNACEFYKNYGFSIVGEENEKYIFEKKIGDFLL